MKLISSNGLTTPLSMLSYEWRKPFNISIGLHVIVLALAMLAPSLFGRQPKLPEIYTVNLFTAIEVAESAAPAAKAPTTKTAAPRQIEPETKKPAISIQPSKPEVAPAVKTTIIKPISLQPLKQKIKLGKTKEEEELDKAKLSQVVQRLKASAAQKEARVTADEAAKDAVSKLVRSSQDKYRTNNRDRSKSNRPNHFYNKIGGNHRPQGNRHRA